MSLITASLSPLQKLFNENSSKISGEFFFNQPLSKCTYYRMGGPAEVLFSPKNYSDLKIISDFLKVLPFKIWILGAGSNVLISDDGLPGLVIRTFKLNQYIEFDELPNSNSINTLVKLGASVSISQLVKEGVKNGWDGVQALVGIPGLVGGMIAMNAGTHIGEIKDFVISLKCFSLKSGELQEFEINRSDLGEYFNYRTARFLKPLQIITEVVLEFPKNLPTLIDEQVKTIYQRRKNTQPVNLPSCGSVFKNPDDYSKKSWQIIDELGLRGARIGDAQISEKHPNFIVNLGNAKACEVYQLIQLVKSKAAEMGVILTEEVKILGSFDSRSL